MAHWTCGFEIGNKNVYLTQGWVGSGGVDASPVHKSLQGHGGNFSYVLDDNVTSPNFGVGGRWFHMWWNPHSQADTAVTFYKSAVATFSVVLHATAVTMRRGNGVSTVVATGGGLNMGTAHWIAIELEARESPNGNCRLYVDGVLHLAYTAADTRNAVTDDWDQFGFSITNQNANVDDIIITTAAEGQLGEHFIVPLVPDGDDVTGLTPSTGVNNYALVDEIPPVTTDYNEATATLQEDTYTFQGLVADLGWTPPSIHCVTLLGYSGRDGTIAQSNLIMKPVATQYFAGAVTLPAAPDYLLTQNTWTLNPETASAWAVSEVDALKAGIRFI